MVRYLQRTISACRRSCFAKMFWGEQTASHTCLVWGAAFRLQNKSRTPKAQIMLETLLIVAASGVGSLALIVRELRKAPEGYEDEHGFHIGICAY